MTTFIGVLESLQREELNQLTEELRIWEAGHAGTMEDIAFFLYRGGGHPPGNMRLRSEQTETRDRRPRRVFWDLVKAEMYLFLCTDDKKYSALRSDVGRHGNKSAASLIAIISAQVGAEINAEAGMLAGFCTLVLYALGKIGKESLCSQLAEAKSTAQP